MTQRRIDAPAKINLGLEILGKRPDGFHEIRTILCKISLHDTLVFEDAWDERDRVTIEGSDFHVPGRDNLIVRALGVMREAGAAIAPQHVSVQKRIPAAAGLGGASSDAAATLIAFTPEVREAGIDPAGIAATLGSDVPFFLDGEIALAAGRGEVLHPLPSPVGDKWVVLVTPDVAIPEKTKTMYGAVDPSWWSTGESVQAIANQLPALPTSAPPNVFERALLRHFPELETCRQRMTEAGCPFVALTGAGPTFYTLVASQRRAGRIADPLRNCELSVETCQLGWRVAQR